MITQATLRRFRCFERFSIADLGRVNLVVGPNGAGKTSLLEGVRLLRSGGNPLVLLSSAIERGEYDSDESGSGHIERVALLRFAFFGRQAEDGAWFDIEGSDGDETQAIRAAVVDASMRNTEAPQIITASPNGATQLKGMFPEWTVRLTRLGSSGSVEVPLEWSHASAQRLRLPAPRLESRVLASLPVFLRANAVNDDALARLWDRIAATPAKDAVIAALKRLEPNIRDIDLRADPRLPFRSRVSIRVENGASTSAPIGSFGEGMTWMFALALAAAGTRSNLLLIDDVDAGLHHRVMSDMWTMIIDIARAQDLQVFATTHSVDCLHALRRVCVNNEERASAVRVVRVIKGDATGISFTAKELDAAIEGEVEVRG